MTNAYLELADRQISAPRQARLRTTEKRAERKIGEHQTAEAEQLNAAWRQWQNKRRAKLLTGPHSVSFRNLIRFLENMTLESGAALITAVETGPWRHADADTKFEVLGFIDTAIIALRERHDLPPFDDSLPHEPGNVFQIIREVLS